MNRLKRCIRGFVLVVSLVLVAALLCVIPALETGAGGRGAVHAQVSAQAEVSLTSLADATLLEAHPNTNYGVLDADGLILGRKDGGRARALLKFSVADIPLGATISSATLRIYQGGWYDYPGSVRTISISRVTQGWHEAVATWNYAPSVGSQVGSVSVPMIEGWYSVNVTSIVQDWYTGATPNDGLLLRGYESEGVYRLFASRHHTGQPELIVNYTVQPTTLSVSSSVIEFMTDGSVTVPESAVLRVENAGTGVMNWSLDYGGVPWLDVDPSSGATSASYDARVTIGILTDTLSAGTYTTPVTVTASGGAQGSPQVVQVSVTHTDGPLGRIYLPLVLRDSTGDSSPPGTEGLLGLFVGISDYEDLSVADRGNHIDDYGDGDLVYAHMDPSYHHSAAAFSGSMDPEEGRMLRGQEATYDGMEQAIEDLDAQEEAGAGAAVAGFSMQSSGYNTVMFTFSGHGGPDGSGSYFIAPYDTVGSPSGYTNIVTAETLDSWLDPLDTGNVFVSLDACYVGGMIPALSQGGRIVVAAAQSDQSSWETSEFNGGVFTHYLIQGLMDPAADTNGDGCISAEEAFSYADGRTNSYVNDLTGNASDQNPQMYDGISGELCLSVLPTYGPMSSSSIELSGPAESSGLVRKDPDFVPLPVILTPMR